MDRLDLARSFTFCAVTCPVVTKSSLVRDGVTTAPPLAWTCMLSGVFVAVMMKLLDVVALSYAWATVTPVPAIRLSRDRVPTSVLFT